MKEMLRRFYKNTWLGQVVLRPIKRLYDFIYYHYVPEETVTKLDFKRFQGYKLDLKNPVTLNEKIQWLKLNDRTPLHTKCADKYAVRGYIKEVIGEEYLVPLSYQTLNPRDIIPGNLPDFPVIIKTNHDGSGGIVIKDKAAVDWR